MKELNAIIVNGKVYEAVEKGYCVDCAFDKDIKKCRVLCYICKEKDSNFRFSQELTDKINEK